MANPEITSELQTQLAELTKYQQSDLISRTQWGTINFESAQGDIDMVLSMAVDLSNLPLQFLTDSTTQQIINQIEPVQTQLERIDGFSIESSDPLGTRNQLVKEFHSVAETFHAVASPHIPYLSYRRGDIAESIEKLNQYLKEGRDALDEAQESLTQKKKQIDETVRAAQDAAASVGVSTFTQEFDTEAGTLEDHSIKWLWATIALALLTVVSAIGFYFWPEMPEKPEIWETLRNVFSKAATVAVLFTGTVWCGRIYRAYIHQARVNKHRALGLKTFQAFAKSTDDPAVRDAVLIAATKSIFGSVPTGFVDQSRADDSGLNVIELARNLGNNSTQQDQP